MNERLNRRVLCVTSTAASRRQRRIQRIKENEKRADIAFKHDFKHRYIVFHPKGEGVIKVPPTPSDRKINISVLKSVEVTTKLLEMITSVL